MLESGQPDLVPQCVHLIDSLRQSVGDDIFEGAQRQLSDPHQHIVSRSDLVEPEPPPTPGFDVYVGMLPRGNVAADFFEVIPNQDGRLALVIGDAPSKGLKSTVVGRFLGHVMRSLIEKGDCDHLGQTLDELLSVVKGHEYFDRVTLQCISLNPGDGVLAMANAGHPDPLLFRAQSGDCRPLSAPGQPLSTTDDAWTGVVHHQQRRTKFASGDVLVAVTDGLTEDGYLTEDRFGYRFSEEVRSQASASAATIGRAILKHWRQHARQRDYADDLTLIVVCVR